MVSCRSATSRLFVSFGPGSAEGCDRTGAPAAAAASDAALTLVDATRGASFAGRFVKAFDRFAADLAELFAADLAASFAGRSTAGSLGTRGTASPGERKGAAFLAAVLRATAGCLAARRANFACLRAARPDALACFFAVFADLRPGLS